MILATWFSIQSSWLLLRLRWCCEPRQKSRYSFQDWLYSYLWFFHRSNSCMAWRSGLLSWHDLWTQNKGRISDVLPFCEALQCLMGPMSCLCSLAPGFYSKRRGLSLFVQCGKRSSITDLLRRWWLGWHISGLCLQSTPFLEGSPCFLVHFKLMTASYASASCK